MEAESRIYYHIEDIEFQLDEEKKYTDWLLLIGEKEQVSIDKITYIFCSDDYLLDINKTYLDHDYYTDIITFPYKQGKEIESDIFISIDRVKDNAVDAKISFLEELHRVMSHGLLHLVGYGDKSDADAKIMRLKEEECIQFFMNVAT